MVSDDGGVVVDVRKICCPESEFRPLFPTGEGVLLRLVPLLLLLLAEGAVDGDDSELFCVENIAILALTLLTLCSS